MLITKEVEIVLNPENINRFELLGYNIPRYYDKSNYKTSVKRGTKLIIKVEDLTPSSHNMVKVKCDYCGEEKDIEYRYYYNNINNEFINKYACKNCIHLKKQEILIEKQKLNLLTRKDKGYWLFKENRYKELKLYIEKHKTISGMQNNKEGALIYSIFDQYNNDSNLKDACIELGYDYSSLLRFKREETYYDDYDNLKNDIVEIINELGRFPKQKEVLNKLHISNNILLKYGGINSIKLDMNYNDENDLIDDRGFYNRSICEYITAQYFIANNLSYFREQHPFTDKYKNYRSDFTFYLLDNKIIQVEVWGYSKNDNSSKRAISYNIKRQLKEKLYKECNYILIGIDYEIFYKQGYNGIQNSLYELFKDYIDLKYKYVNQEIIIPSCKLTDKELLNELMKYSSDKNMLPLQDILDKNNKSGLYLEVIKRYGSYYNFANTFGKHTYSKFNEWTQDNIFEGFKYMINNYNHILKNEEYKQLSSKDRNITGFMEIVKKYFSSYIDARLCFYEYCLNNSLTIQEDDILYLYNLINIKKGFNKKTATNERIEKASYILNKNNNLKDVS